MKTIHVFPTRDREPHYFHGTCLCMPRIDENDFVVHHPFEECGAKWTYYEVDETTVAEYHFSGGETKMTQYVDVDGNLQEVFEDESEV